MTGFWDWWNGKTDTVAQETESMAPTTDYVTSSSASETKDIELTFGVTARDIVTGFTGIVMSRDLHLSGTEQWTLQPKCEDGKSDKYPHGYPFDTERLEVLDEGVSDFSNDIDPYIIELGEKVEDVVSGHIGIVVEIIEQFNGCVHVRSLSKAVPGDKTSGTYITLDHKRFKVLGDGVSVKGEDPVPTSKTGCCITRDDGPRDRF